jgi:hypothetical protein
VFSAPPSESCGESFPSGLSGVVIRDSSPPAPRRAFSNNSPVALAPSRCRVIAKLSVFVRKRAQTLQGRGDGVSGTRNPQYDQKLASYATAIGSGAENAHGRDVRHDRGLGDCDCPLSSIRSDPSARSLLRDRKSLSLSSVEPDSRLKGIEPEVWKMFPLSTIVPTIGSFFGYDSVGYSVEISMAIHDSFPECDRWTRWRRSGINVDFRPICRFS